MDKMIVLPDGRPGREGISQVQAFECAMMFMVHFKHAQVYGPAVWWQVPGDREPKIVLVEE